ncbi:hypothetical protein [Streptomyces sp. NPDC050428]|uniref:hypothetical protein n=1 Tax=Streptomyces sp. NPDC050428 TaxID=3155757 RepID=UPI003449A07B
MRCPPPRSGVTTLYWQVDTKDDVVDLALDAIIGELPPADGAADLEWRAAILALLVDWRTTMSFRLSEEDRETAQRRLRDRSAEYPTLSANQYILEDDWDGTFVTGLGYVLDGIAAAGER